MAKAEIRRIVMDMVDENCYIVYKDGRGVIVDPGEGFDRIQKAVEELNVKCKFLMGIFSEMEEI